MAMQDEGEHEIDEALYSRQLYVLGHEAMKRMGSAGVLLVGCGGVGVEIAKNLVLAGVKSVDICDPQPVTHHDLASQFFVGEQDVGKPRVEVTVPKLTELNQYVRITGHTAEPTPAQIAHNKVVVACDLPLSSQIALNQLCREHGSYFVGVTSRGVFASVFCDFGDKHVVHDKNGEQPSACILASVTQDEHGVVTVVDDARHNLEDGDFVQFSDVKGMVELNSLPPQKVEVVDPYSFRIGDTSGFGAYVSGGRFVQVPQPVEMSFLPLSQALASPEFVDTDLAKPCRPALLHACEQALDKFHTQHSRLPAPGSKDDAALFLSLAQAIAPDLLGADNEANANVVRLFAHCATGQLNPVAAFVGGVAAQEALKGCTGKFTPIKQFLYFDAVEALPANVLEMDAKEFVPPPELVRYTGQVSVLGNTLQAKLLALRYFVVGAGAIGCEMLKNMALMGVGCGEGGSVVVTDMDSIEKSNLNRQFLFRPRHIGSAKSVVAADMARGMNPAFNVVGRELRVGPDTEVDFNDDFFNALDGVCNALDNVEARLYMDARCVLFQKPLLESGTLGTKGNVQVVVPHLTESYGSSMDPPEKGIPVCTLKFYPNKIEHTIQWAREEFEGLFANQPNDVNQYLSTPEFVEQVRKQHNTRTQVLDGIRKNLVDDRPLTFEQCVAWARLRFEEMFSHSMRQLLHNFPLDMKNSHGHLFWSGSKQAPTPLEFDPDNELHMDFIIASANLRAFNYGLKVPPGKSDPAYFKPLLARVQVPVFNPREVHIPASDQEASSMQSAANGVAGAGGDGEFEGLVAALPAPSSLAGYRLTPVEFEKDDDTNFHMRMITAASNLRATNYSIPTASLHDTKRIAGKIIPAIATTTALVTGLVSLELIKLLQDKKLDEYKNAFVNLALPFFGLSEPIPPPKVKSGGREWTLWDKTIIDEGDLTLKDFLALFEKKMGVEVGMISYGRSMLYTSFTPKKKLEQRFKMRMSELAESISKAPLKAGTNYLTLEVCCYDADNNDVEVPTVRLRYR